MGGIVHFAPGARTAWHTHPAGQTIYVTKGSAWSSARGEGSRRYGQVPASISSRARIIGTAPWPTASRLAYQEADDSHATWGRHVTDEEYSN
jgi:hypothetical protein